MEFFKKIINTIIKIENEFYNQPGSGAIKKQKVIEIINELLDIPVIPEFLEEKLLGFLVDLIVFIFNKYSLFNRV